MKRFILPVGGAVLFSSCGEAPRCADSSGTDAIEWRLDLIKQGAVIPQLSGRRTVIAGNGATSTP